jgi:alpha-beta hydrolase superfamily lysophospholipase
MPASLLRRALRFTWKAVLGLLLLAFALMLARAFGARRHPDLEPWHRLVLANEVHAADIRGDYSWAQYRQAEARLFAEMARKLAATPRPGRYRYQTGSRMGAPLGQHDWNRSYESTPKDIRGGVLLLHGMSDSPYSMRHLAARYEQAGFAVIAPRMPGHGTVPAGLLDAQWQDWSAVVRVAARELHARTGPGKPFHIVGYSNGGALALKYSMDAALDDGADLPRADRLVLISPMIGVARAARLSQALSLFGGIPYFEKSRWLDTQPEFNPYKYNSFPVNGAVQSYRLTTALQAEMQELEASGRRDRLPPILSFQSVLDATVSTGAVVHVLFDHLPANGSELVLFDINRASVLAPLLKPDATAFADTLHSRAARRYRLTAITNTRADTLAVSERSYAAGHTDASERPLALAFPRGVYSLSHVALPFPMDDGLYGLQPRLDENYGIRLGIAELRGERGALVIDADTLQRLGCNPFYPYMIERIGQTLPHGAATAN